MCGGICTCHFVASLPQRLSLRTYLDFVVGQHLRLPTGLREICERTLSLCVSSQATELTILGLTLDGFTFPFTLPFLAKLTFATLVRRW